MNEISDSSDYSRLRDRPGHLIRRLHQIHVGLFLEECSKFKLTPVQFGVLNVLEDGKSLEQVAIASRLGIDRNNAADVIRRLEKRGLLDRPVSTSDKRAKLARITKQGRQLVEDVFPSMISVQRRLVEPLSEEECDKLMSLMEKLVAGNNDASRARWKIDDSDKAKSEPSKT